MINKMTSTDPVERSWDLSLYELHRTPQEAITDETEIAVSARSLQSELTCPICLDMLTSTMTTKECLHRYVKKSKSKISELFRRNGFDIVN